MKRLAKKVVGVIGGTTGLGLSAAKAFVAEGAKVVAVGSGKLLENGSVRKLEVKAGDKVLFAKYSGSEVKIDGEEHLILREEDILAVVE